ncbi:MAG: hypothetical protein FK734_09080, partial [Asgard group archaeon]|nr:hypothetical protein [Asgard group archaeon]
MNKLMRKIQILTIIIITLSPIFAIELESTNATNNNIIYDFSNDNKGELSNFVNTLETYDYLSDGYVWSQPDQITAPILERDDYIFVRDLNGIFHGVIIKHLSTLGDELNYISSIDNTTTSWSLPSMIIRSDSEITISELNLLVDTNNTLHLAYISKRQTIWQINYLYKYANQTSWINSAIIKREYNFEYSSLVSTLSDNILELVWIKKQLPSSGSVINSTLLMTTRNLSTNKWSTINTIFDEDNPNKVEIIYSEKNKDCLAFTKFDDLSLKYKMYFCNSSNNGESWSDLKLIYEYTNKFDKFGLYLSNITGGFHLLANEISGPIHHLEFFVNGSIYNTDELINGLNGGYFAGLVENSSTKDIYIFYETIITGKSDIFYRKRLGSTLTWQTEHVVTDKDHSIHPLFILDNSFAAINYGYLFYITYQSLVVVQFNEIEYLSDEVLVYQSTRNNGQGSIGVDSFGTIHFIWEYIGTYSTKVYYEYKTQNDTWHIMEPISGTHLTSSTTPRLLIDSDDNVHCFFIANDIMTGYNGIYYVT